MYNYYYQQQNIEDRRQQNFALVAYLPEELNNIIEPLRERFDPIYNQVAAHLTVIFPFETELSLEELTAIIQQETEQEKEIDIELSSIIDFYPEYPVIGWKVKENEQLTGLYYRLYSLLGMPIPHRNYKPHVTVAREISNHRVMLVKEKVVPYLPDEKIRLRALDLITPLSSYKWVSVRTFPLIDSLT